MVFGRVWAGYNAMLEKNPLFTKALTSFTGFTAGDVLAQKFVMPDEEKGYDVARTLRLGKSNLGLNMRTAQEKLGRARRAKYAHFSHVARTKELRVHG